MCCLFGFVDYAGSLSVKQKGRLIREPTPLVLPTTRHADCKFTSVR